MIWDMVLSTSLNVRRVRTEGLVCCVRFKESNLTVIYVLVCNISCQNQQIGSWGDERWDRFTWKWNEDWWGLKFIHLLFKMLISSWSRFFDIPEMTEARKVLKSALSLAPSSSMLISSWATLENLLDNFTPLLSWWDNLWLITIQQE